PEVADLPAGSRKRLAGPQRRERRPNRVLAVRHSWKVGPRPGRRSGDRQERRRPPYPDSPGLRTVALELSTKSSPDQHTRSPGQKHRRRAPPITVLRARNLQLSRAVRREWKPVLKFWPS